MQIRMRCFKCQTLFVVKTDEIKSALETLQAEKFKHYNSHCPKCGRSNKISAAQLKKALPNWKPSEEQVSEE